jgi:hypothetical protein
MKSFKISLLLFILVSASGELQAQDAITSNSIRWGIEQDVLPYLTGGYYAGGWVGKSHIRARVLMARVLKPSLVVPDGFTNNWVSAYALVGDYYHREDLSGWWISGGLVLWHNTIQTNLLAQTATYDSYMLNGSLGYSWRFGKHFYLTPWAGMHIRIGGENLVTVDGKSFKPAVLNPEASLKIGWVF